jgi:uncharacterized phiE125 gp8 family phage protein
MSVFNLNQCVRGSGLTGQRTKPYIEGWEFNYELTTAADGDPVTLAEAKAFARIDPTGDASADTDNDNIVTELITSATRVFESQSGRALVAQTWTAWLDCVPCSGILQLNKGRIESVTSIKGYDEGGNATTLDSGAYEVDNDNARIGLVGSNTWPDATRQFKSFEVVYVAGYADAAAVPEEAKSAIKQMVSHWYEHRETATDLSFQTVPFGTKLLINRLTIGRV